MFDNATSHLIYTKDTLQVAQINKGPEPFLQPGWYTAYDGNIISKEMSTLVVNSSIGQLNIVQRGIQTILVKWGL